MPDVSSQTPFIGITIEAVLRPCEIYPIATAYGHGYAWEWACVDGDAHSHQTFDLFFDCLEDARHHGYEPHFLDRQQDLTVVAVSASA
ncbi:MAG TPA: hypothetical protein VED01_12705 [Burkholderiales bacterium]|nr:hypothetical protein [Burkholderiales bacterium]